MKPFMPIWQLIRHFYTVLADSCLPRHSRVHTLLTAKLTGHLKLKTMRSSALDVSAYSGFRYIGILA